MSNITSLRPLAAVVAAALAATLLIALPSRSDGATTIDYPNTERIPGDDPVEIGVNISQRLFGNDGAQAVVLARKDKFPDALGGSTVAAEFGGPVLYTTSTDLDTATRNEIDRVLAPGDNVYIMGEVAAISVEVEQELQARGYRTPRLGGQTRVETAAEAAFAVGAGPGRTAIIARAFDDPGAIESTQGWVDSVSCGGYAALSETPVLLTDKNRDPQRIPEATRSMLQRLGISEVFICGGPAAVPQAHADDIAAMGIKVNRFAGATRIETAVDVASNLWGYRTTDGKAFIIVNGWGANFAYGLAASQLSRREAAPILLVNRTEPTSCSGNEQSRATLCYLAQHNPSISGLIAVGDVSLVDDVVFRAAAEAGGLEEDNTAPARPSNVSATDRPEDDGTNVNVKWAASTDDNPGPITYNVYFRNNADDEALTRANSTRRTTSKTSLTITGLTEGQSYDVAVDAVDQFGNRSGLSAVASAGPLEDEVPAAPSEAPTAKNTTTGVGLSWKRAPEADAAAYRIERAEPTGGGPIQEPCDSPFLSWAHVKNVSPRSTTSFIDTTAKDGIRYCYRYRVLDTSSPANESGTSPVTEWTFDKQNPDQNAPAGTPSMYAVNIDQDRRLVGTTNNSRMRAGTTLRVDAVVPAGAYSASETLGRIAVYDGDTRLSAVDDSDEFDPTGAEQIVSVFVALNATGERSISVAMQDATGNEGTRSTVWRLDVNAQHLPTPVIESIAAVNTDPADLLDQRIPDAPGIDATPRIVVGNLDPSAGNQRLQVYRNDEVDASFCLTPNQMSGGQFVINAGPGDSDYTLPGGAHPLLVTAQPAVFTSPSTCIADPIQGAARRSGDSNTVRYLFETAEFGILAVDPPNNAFDPYGFRDGGAVPIEVVFNKDATTTSRVTLSGPGIATPITVENDGADGDSTAGDERIDFDAPPLQTGQFELDIVASPLDGIGSGVSTTTTFTVGFIHLVHGSKAVGGGNGSTNAPSGSVTFVVDAAAPSGTYRVFSSAATCPAAPVATLAHSAGTTTRNNTADPGGELIWTYQSNSRPDQTFCQDDGAIPAGLTAADRALLGIRQTPVASTFFVDGIGNTAFEDTILVYRPGQTSLGTTTWQTDATVVRQADGSTGRIPNERVRPSWEVYFYVRDDNGNESVAGRDGLIRRLNSIRANDGLPANPPTGPELQAGDFLELFFNGVTLDDIGPPLGGNGGIVILAGDKLVNPKFGSAGSGGSSANQSGNLLKITFGSNTTVGGQPVPQPVTPPTSVHGGANWFGVNWLVDISADGDNSEESGHVVLLPPEEEAVSTTGTF
ncbi:MAG: cell wall-binding repeat-containing protein [Actinobacteria bacterium]|nr:cell wall-binding repeat-containing protein [Actinomycetota bacterium]